jgi:hypothetical protein
VRSAWRRTLVLFSAPFALFPFVLTACPKDQPAQGADAGAASASVSASASASSGAPDGGDDEEVKPVYTIDPNAPPDPVAQKLCTGLMEVLPKRKAECCKTAPGLLLTSECVGLLGAAIRAKAIVVDEGKVTACVAALDKTFAGCDWVGPFPPPVPEECVGIFAGKIAKGQRCRSNLECEGTLRCHGVGPTTPGKCGPPRKVGESCGGTDVLASYTRQDKLERLHPPCEARCVRGSCVEPAADGAKCMITADCAAGSQCIDKKCVKRAPSKAGEACPGEVCEEGTECILGKCGKRKPAGEVCTEDFECVAGCVGRTSDAGAGKKGKCGMRCDVY